MSSSRALGARSGKNGAACSLAALGLIVAHEASSQGTSSPGAAIVEEIVVTAQKRAESIQDVPASISVLGAETFERISATSLSDYAAYVPGLTVESGGTPGQALLVLRGLPPIGPRATVGTYVDESPFGSTTAANTVGFALDVMPYDIDRVEVLRGPQGTLYGAGALGGVLRYQFRAPDLEQHEFRAGVDGFDIEGAGNLGWNARVGANIPLVLDRVALRGSYFRQDSPGYIDNGLTGETDRNGVIQESGRLALLWQLSDEVSLKLTAMRQDIDADGNAATALDPVSLEPLTNSLSDRYSLEQPFHQRQRYYAATLEWKLSWADFTSASSYSESFTRQQFDATPTYGTMGLLLSQGAEFPFVGFDQTVDLEKFTQEFRFSSPTGSRIEWLLGGFYTEEKSRNIQFLSALDASGAPLTGTPVYGIVVDLAHPSFDPGNPFFPFTGLLPGVGLSPFAVSDVPERFKEYAAFGNLTYRFSERFDATAGLRWARNEQRNAQFLYGALIAATSDGGTQMGGNSAEDVLTYMLSTRFHVTDHNMIYARVASGYRPGGANAAFPGVPPQYDSDELVNYELGVKSDFLDGRAVLALAGYYIDWSDIQIDIPNPGGPSYGGNGGRAESRGVELTLSLVPIERFRVGATVAFTDSKLANDAPSLDGLDGDRLPLSPEWNASLTADYEWQVHTFTARVGGGLRYVGERGTEVESNPSNIELEDYTALDLNASLGSERWTAKLYVKNVTDERAYLGSSLFTDSATGDRSLVTAALLQPRTVGIGFDFNF